MRTETEHTIFLKDYTPSPYRIVSVDMDFRIGIDNTRVRAQLTVEPREGTAGVPWTRMARLSATRGAAQAWTKS